MLLTELSANFVSATSESINRQIVDAQRRIVQELDLDRSTLAQLEGGGDRFAITHSWHLPGLEPFPGFAVKDLPWMSSAVLNGEVVLFARIDDLPPEATREKEAARRFGPRSNVTFPLKVGGHVIGAIAQHGTPEREWPQAIVNRLRLFVEMIGSAIARTHAERALHESENKLRLILDSTAEAIYGVDLDGKCTFCNTACLRTLGYERSDELLGGNMHHLAHQTGGDETIFPSEGCGICRAAHTGEAVHVDNEVLWRANGTSFPVEYWCYPQFRGEEMVGVVVAFLDITPRKLAEAALAGVSRKLLDAQEQERGRIARELHDDIGQRLALLAVELDQLHEDLSDSPEVHSRMDELHKQASEIATDIQTLSHDLHSAKLEDLGPIGAMRSLCQELGEQTKVKIEFKTQDLPNPLPPDTSLCLFRVLQEALRNAIKHSEAQHVEVELWRTPDEIHLAVSDRGVGFDSKAARASRGLGLVSMEERLKLLNGSISIESQPNRGTTIHARLPLS